MNTFCLVEEESGRRPRKLKRRRMLTPAEARSIVAVKRDGASPTVEPYLSLVQMLVRNGLGIECGCRPDKPGGLLLGTRRKRDGRIFLVNLPRQDVAHAEDCVFRVERPPMPPIVHSDVFKLLSRADARHSDIDPDSPDHRKSRGLSQGQRPRTMRDVLLTLMHTARLHGCTGSRSQTGIPRRGDGSRQSEKPRSNAKRSRRTSKRTFSIGGQSQRRHRTARIRSRRAGGPVDQRGVSP